MEYNTDTSAKHPNNRMMIQSDTLMKIREVQDKEPRI